MIPALALAAAQLLPTLELNDARAAHRRAGLPPGGQLLAAAAAPARRPSCPPFGGGLDAAFGSEGYAEFVGYVGHRRAAAGRHWASCAAGGDGARTTGARAGACAASSSSAVGAFLALGAYNPLYYLLWRFVPGFDLFRAPARWLELFALGAALLAALGLELAARAAAPPRFRRAAARVMGCIVALVAGRAIVALPGAG